MGYFNFNFFSFLGPIFLIISAVMMQSHKKLFLTFFILLDKNSSLGFDGTAANYTQMDGSVISMSCLNRQMLNSVVHGNGWCWYQLLLKKLVSMVIIACKFGFLPNIESNCHSAVQHLIRLLGGKSSTSGGKFNLKLSKCLKIYTFWRCSISVKIVWYS